MNRQTLIVTRKRRDRGAYTCKHPLYLLPRVCDIIDATYATLVRLSLRSMCFAGDFRRLQLASTANSSYGSVIGKPEEPEELQETPSKTERLSRMLVRTYSPSLSRGRHQHRNVAYHRLNRV